jgi:hypothetical protein
MMKFSVRLEDTSSAETESVGVMDSLAATVAVKVGAQATR